MALEAQPIPPLMAAFQSNITRDKFHEPSACLRDTAMNLPFMFNHLGSGQLDAEHPMSPRQPLQLHLPALSESELAAALHQGL